jgi:hypothetical protein
LFGQGLVATADNFGQAGARPTHPELLDWLAVEFMHNGWRIKPLLRLLLTSNTYRQTSAATPSADPGAELFGRQALRPLEAEIVRDCILAVSGSLDATAGGEPIPCAPQSGGVVRIPEKGLPTPQSKHRRSVYLQTRHRYHLSFLEVFDQPEVAGNCLRRVHAPVVGQALTMLNDPFVAGQAAAFAERVQRETRDADPAAWIDRAFQLALGRPAGPDEQVWAAELLQRQAERYRAAGKDDASRQALGHLCQMLLNCSEFLYVP